MPDEIPGIGFHLATIGYMATGTSFGIDTVKVGIGSNLIADYEGNPAPVRLGSPQNPIVSGDQEGALGDIGFIEVLAPFPSLPPVATDATINSVIAGTLISHTFSAMDDFTPANLLLWSNLEFRYFPAYGGFGSGPFFQPTLDEDGLFTWNTARSPRGIYTALATVTDEHGLSDQATLTISIFVPELALYSVKTPKLRSHSHVSKHVVPNVCSDLRLLSACRTVDLRYAVALQPGPRHAYLGSADHAGRPQPLAGD